MSGAGIGERKTIGRRARRERGQALIIAVLVMLVLAALAGLFIIVVSWGLAQSVTEGERIGAQYLAEAGIRFAADQLIYGPEGADWRPPVPAHEWAEYPYGEGRFRLRVTYEPRPDDPLSRYIKIEAEGRRSAARYRLVSYARLLLPDYLRFVTNSDKSARRADLGARFYVYGTDPEGNRVNMGPYKTFWEGSIHTNSDLQFFGENEMLLLTTTPPGCPMRDDNVTASRYISRTPEGVPLTVDLGGTTFDVGPTFRETRPPVVEELFETAEGHYRDGVVTHTGIDGYSRAASYYEAPMIDLGSVGTAGHRYHVLTRDSGQWLGTGDQRYNTGWYGYGDGIYIDNFADMDEARDYDTWRQNWVEAAATGVYPETPRGVAIWLHPGDTDRDGVPDLTIQRDDASWRDPDDPSSFLGPVVTLPYPRNGVIFAEGNVRIGGVMPQSPGIAYDENDPYPGYYRAPRIRRYDLTVVSGGNIYIEGALCSEGMMQGRREEESTIGLLALENVCLDATKVLRPIGTAVVEPGSTRVATIRPGESYGVEFSTVGLDDYGGMQLYLRHAGTQGPPGYSTQIQLLIDGQPYPGWGDGSGIYRLSLTAPWAEDSAPVIWPQWEAIPCTETDPWTGTVIEKYIDIGDRLLPGPLHRIELVAPSSRTGLPYQLFDLAVQPLPVWIYGLVYAQRGSWYVLSGPWFDDGSQEDAGRLPSAVQVTYTHDEDGRPRPGFPRPQEPLDIKLVFEGAISENRTAPIGDVVTWTERWRGADEYWLTPQVGNRAPAMFGLQYHYNPYLSYNVGANRPRLPRLPVSPVLVSAEETTTL